MPLNKTIAISMTEGRVIRDLFYNGMLAMINGRGYDVLIISPVARVPHFVETWSGPMVRFAYLPSYNLSSRNKRLFNIRNRVMQLGKINILDRWMALEHRLWTTDPTMTALLKENNCCLAVITQPMFLPEMLVYEAAKSLDLPTLGVMRSWDNFHRSLNIRPDILAVWNPVNRQEAFDLKLYPPERVVVVGGTPFDAYFTPKADWSREEFARGLDLDPERPIITLATLGPSLGFDETHLVDFLIKAISEGQIPGQPQLIIRLHPSSRLEVYLRYQENPDVRISYINNYIPTLSWTMSRDEVIFMANLLRHSDVVVSPGSTITIETAIFDTPTVIPTFHPYQPELARFWYDRAESWHFKRILTENLIPILREPEELIPAINRGLADPGWYREQRAQLVKDYFYYTDGQSTQRLADLILKMAGDS